MFFFQLLVILFIYVLSTHVVSKFRNLPRSPFPALPIIGHLYLLKKRDPIHRSLSKISAKHGPVLLLQFGVHRVLVVSTPSVAEECFSKNDIVFANRPLLLAGKHMGYNFKSMAWAPYGDYWRNLRKLAALELLSSHRLQLLSAIRSDEVKLLIRSLCRHTDEALDMKSAFFGLTQNVMMMMIAGKRYYGDNNNDVGVKEEARKFREIVTETFSLSGASSMGDFLPLVAAVTGTEKKMVELQRKRDDFIQNLIEESRKIMMTSSSESEERKFKTLIQVLLSLQESEPEYYTDETIKSLMMVLLAAGTDTSSGTMEWALSVLLNSPEIMQRAQTEIDEVIGNNRLVSESDLEKLPYLHCVIKETMRMYPVAPLLIPHESSEECSVGGYRVPRATMLLVNMWSIHNDPSIWEEPTKFKPERFRGSEGMRDGFRLLPFGSGRRGCPGESLATRMVGLALGTVLQCFEWERVGKEMVDMTEGTGLTMPKAQPLLARCRPRPSAVSLVSHI